MCLYINFVNASNFVKSNSTITNYAIHTVSPMLILIQDKYYVHCSFGFRLTISGMNIGA